MRLQPPELSDDLLERHDTTERMVAGFSRCRLTAVVAPAGYGKTTLLASAVRRLDDTRWSWLGLGRSQDEPVRFWAALARALSRAGTVPTVPAPAHEGGPDDPQIRVARARDAMLALLDALQEMAAPMVVVLDDLHEITDAAIHRQLAFLLEHAPPALHAAVGSRREPALPLARLRAQGELSELRVPDLRFSRPETEELFAARGIELPAEELRSLHERTGGWPAGVRLALGSLVTAGSIEDRADRARALARSERHMRDVLADEVLAHLEDDDREFLLDVAVMDEVTPTEARQLTGRRDAGARLDRLYRSGIVLLSRARPSPEQEPVYRHHSLFSSLLRQRLREQDPDRHAAQHRRAAELAADPARRATHLAEVDGDLLAQELEEHGGALIRDGRARAVLSWLETLPAMADRRRPGLMLLEGHARWQVGDHVRAGAAFRRAAEAFRATGDADREAAALVAAADCALLAGTVEQAGRDIRRALDGELPRELRGRAHAARLRVAQFGSLDAIDAAAAEAVRAAVEHPEPATLRDTARSLWMGVGVAPRGLDLLQQFCDVAGPVVTDDDRFARACLLGLSATVALYRGDPDAAAEQASAALGLWDDLGVAPPIHTQSARVLLVLALTAVGDHARLDRRLPELRAGAEEIALPAAKLSAGLAEARVRWLRQDLPGLQAVAERLPRIEGPAAALADTVHGMCALLEGDPATAIDVLTDAAGVEQSLDRRNLFGATPVLLASIHADRGDASRALEVGLPTLDACVRDRCTGRILLEGPRALPLLELAADAGIHVGVARRLATRLGATITGPQEVPDTGETLTAREVEILRLVSGGATNPQIASRLDISDETVKTHVSRILRKLDAPTRTAAAARARRLGLPAVPPEPIES